MRRMNNRYWRCFVGVIFRTALAGGSFLLFSCAVTYRSAGEVTQADICDAMLTQPRSFFYIDTTAYPRSDKSLPIGVFDSGTGGLTVLDAIVRYDGFDNLRHLRDSDGDGRRDFQSERFIYFGDQANMPYGDYGLENNLPLLREHIFKDVQFLLGHRYYRTALSRSPENDKPPVKAIVIACNTATAYGKTEIEQFLQRARLEVKVIGVIDAGVRGALAYFDQTESATIAVMATPGTVASYGYPNALAEQMALLGYTGCIELLQQPGHGIAGAIDGASEFIAPAVKEPRSEYKGPSSINTHAVIDTLILRRYGFDWQDHHMLYRGDRQRPQDLQINSVENYIAYNLVSLLEQVRSARPRHPLKVLILGCTHYPFYRDVFDAKLKALYDYQEQGEYIYRPFLADTVHLVDPAVNTAQELYEYLHSKNLYNSSDLTKSEFYISVANRDNPNVEQDGVGNFTWRYKYGRKAGEIQEYVKVVPFSPATISTDTINRFKRTIPSTFELIPDLHQPEK